jgi:hypothetical protein
MLKVVFLALALAGCTVTTDEQDAAAACGVIVNPNIRDTCMANYVSNEQAGRNAQWNMIGASMLNRPVQTSCMNIGGIVTCSSR